MEHRKLVGLGPGGLGTLDITLEDTIVKARLTGPGVDNEWQKTVAPGTTIDDVMPEIFAVLNLANKPPS